MRPWSCRTRRFLFTCLVGATLLNGCQIAGRSGEQNTQETPLVDEKYSLTADRKALEELRKDIPEEKKKENDELAFLGQLFADEKKPPSQIREKFDSILRKKRELFQKDMTKARETYVKEEKKRREVFNKEQEQAKDDFKKRKVTREVRSEFFNELDAKRKSFTSEEREKRDNFESDMRDKRKNFDDYAREKTSEFTQELRAYTKRFEELQKSKSPNP